MTASTPSRSYRRIVVKISGESLKSPSGEPFDHGKAADVVKNLAALSRTGVQIVVVIGGGNLGRGRDHSQMQMTESDADAAGMYATGWNAIKLAGQLKYIENVDAQIYGRGICALIDGPYNKKHLLAGLRGGAVAIIAGGMGEGGQSTDVAAIRQAIEVDADAVLMSKFGTDGVYDADPNDPNRVSEPHLLKKLTASEAVARKPAVMDTAALGWAIQGKVLIHVFDARDNTLIVSVAQGADQGSVITGE